MHVRSVVSWVMHLILFGDVFTWGSKCLTPDTQCPTPGVLAASAVGVGTVARTTGPRVDMRPNIDNENI